MASRLEVDRAWLAWWVAGSLLTVGLVYVLWSFVGTFVFGVFLYYATRPVYRRLRRRVRPNALAAALALFALALPALLLLAYTLGIAIQEANRLLAVYEFGQLEAVVGRYVDVSQLARDPMQLLEQESARAALQSILNDALNYLGFIGNFLLHLFVMISIAYYLLKDDDDLAAWGRSQFANDGGVLVTYARAVDRDFSNIFFGNILNAILTAIIGAVSYNLLNYVAPEGLAVPYATLLGLIAGVASLIPVVGMKLVYVPVAGYLTYVATATGSRLLWFPAAFVALSFVVVDSIPDFVLRPYVSGRGLHLGMVMFAYIFGPLIWGWYGIFLGPMLLVLIVHFVRLVAPVIVTGDAARAVPPSAAGGDDPDGAQVTPEADDTSAQSSQEGSDPGGKPEGRPDQRDRPADAGSATGEPEPPAEDGGPGTGEDAGGDPSGSR